MEPKLNAARGPAWLGIGAQRAGTTWFTDLLLQHPQVCLASIEKKELHRLYRGLDREMRVENYLRLFDVRGCPGEFTPYYLRALWVPRIVTKVLRDNAPLIAILRDPVERFASAMRFAAPSKGEALNQRQIRSKASDAQWAGMYATQLSAWSLEVPRNRFLVFQYEAIVQDAQAAVESVWRYLGLKAVRLSDVGTRSRTSSVGGWSWPPGLREALVRAYEPEVGRLVDEWGINRELWPNFRDSRGT